MTDSLMTRRRFFQALAASALAAGVPLPVGLAREDLVWTRMAGSDWITEFYFFTRHINSGFKVEITETLGPRRLSWSARVAS